MIKNEYQIMYEAESYYWWYVGLHQLIKKITEDQGNKLEILDAGCGTCRLMQLLSKNHKIEGFDFSEEALKFCKKRNIQDVYLQDLNDWTPQKKYNVIISADVICSVGIKDEENILKNFHKGLKKNGILILNLPALKILSRNHDKAVAIRKRYTKKEIKKLLQNAGFSDIYVNYRLPWLAFIIFLKKIVEKFTKKNEIKSDLNVLPKFLNKIFLLFNKIDNYLIINKIPLPIGSSVFIIARK